MAFRINGGGDGDGYGDDFMVTNGVSLQKFSRVIIIIVNVWNITSWVTKLVIRSKTLKCDFIDVITGS